MRESISCRLLLPAPAPCIFFARKKPATRRTTKKTAIAIKSIITSCAAPSPSPNALKSPAIPSAAAAPISIPFQGEAGFAAAAFGAALFGAACCWRLKFCCGAAAGALRISVGAERPKEAPPPKRAAASASGIVVTIMRATAKTARSFFILFSLKNRGLSFLRPIAEVSLKVRFQFYGDRAFCHAVAMVNLYATFTVRV